MLNNIENRLLFISPDNDYNVTFIRRISDDKILKSELPYNQSQNNETPAN